MLQTVRLKNFQSHKDTTVELIDGVNTFIGTSDHGKSSIMRAINLVVDNKPDGTAYVSHWAVNSKGKIEEDTEVELKFSDGLVLKRVRGIDNAYMIGDQELRAFGKPVPPEIEDAANFSDVNIQRQDQNFFLFSETSGEIIRRINGYVNLDIIDTALSKAEKDARDTKNAIKTNRAQSEDIAEKLKPYDVLDGLEKQYEDAQGLIAEIGRLSTTRGKVADYMGKYESVIEKLGRFKNVERLSRKIDRATLSAEQIKDLRQKRKALSLLVERHEQTVSKISGMVVDIDLSEPTSISRKLDETSDRISILDSLIKKYRDVETRIVSTVELIGELHEKYHEQMGDTCPLCGHKVEA